MSVCLCGFVCLICMFSEPPPSWSRRSLQPLGTAKTQRLRMVSHRFALGFPGSSALDGAKSAGRKLGMLVTSESGVFLPAWHVLQVKTMKMAQAVIFSNFKGQLQAPVTNGPQGKLQTNWYKPSASLLLGWRLRMVNVEVSHSPENTHIIGTHLCGPKNFTDLLPNQGLWGVLSYVTLRSWDVSCMAGCSPALSTWESAHGGS